MIRADTQPEHASTLPRWVVITATALVTFQRDRTRLTEGEKDEMRRSENDRREEVEGTECQKEKDMGEGRRDILPDKQRRRRDVCCAEEMLRKFFLKKGARSRACILHNVLYAVISA